MIYIYLPIFILILILSVFITNKIIKLELSPVRYTEIDGIRGYLALFVFLHHSYIWHVYLNTNKWEEPQSNLFNHFGQTSVSLFFIITAFLFTTKLLESKKDDFEWIKYIKSRFFRMFPMYFISIIAIFIIVFIESNFEIKENVITIFKSSLSWLFFTINGSNEINGFDNTYLIDAGVTWTLPYEWMFYFLLPILALAFKLKVNLKIIISFTGMFIMIALLNKAKFTPFIPFISGVLCALLIYKYNLRHLFQKNIYSIISILLMACSIFFVHRGNRPIPVIITTFLFILIACGNNFFGILSQLFSRKLGQITYSIYLIHGIVLFLVFHNIIGYKLASKLTEIEHWGIISLCIFPIIFISQLTFKYIELPFINFKLKNNNVKPRSS